MTNGKKRFFAGHAKSSAFVISVALHAVLLIAALSFVAVKVIVKEDKNFEAKTVQRPNMKLKKLTVPVNMKKKPRKPKLRKTIVAKKTVKSLDIKMPEVVGIKGGTGYLDGEGGFGIGFNFEMPDLFGGNKRGSGSEFVGYFYDLKQTDKGKLTKIGELVATAETTDYRKDPKLIEATRLYKEALRRFLSGWQSSRLDGFFKAPREKYATSFTIPEIDAEEAPKAFGVDKEVKPQKWLALYRGTIAAPESGKYRFLGRGDDVLVVRIKKRVVLDGSYTKESDWESKDPDNYKYDIYSKAGVVIGDWFHLDKGKSVAMDVLIGEEPGGVFYCQLYIQKDGETYPIRKETYTNDAGEKVELERPILPIFKTADLTDEIVQKMEVNKDWATVDGPNFGVEKPSRMGY